MATAKKVGKKPAKRKSAKKKRPAKRPTATVVYPPFGDPCSLPNICAYLAALTTWFVWFQEDYKALRKAVCNVERVAFGETAGDPLLRFCPGGAGDSPNDPVAPPGW